MELVASIFSCMSFSDTWVNIYLFTYEANWVGKFHSFSMFSDCNSNLQYLYTVPSSDWMDCFLLPPLNWISVGYQHDLLFGHHLTESQWDQWFWTCGSTEFCVGMLVFLQKIWENNFNGYYFKVPMPCTWGYNERYL